MEVVDIATLSLHHSELQDELFKAGNFLTKLVFFGLLFRKLVV